MHYNSSLFFLLSIEPSKSFHALSWKFKQCISSYLTRPLLLNSYVISIKNGNFVWINSHVMPNPQILLLGIVKLDKSCQWKHATCLLWYVVYSWCYDLLGMLVLLRPSFYRKRRGEHFKRQKAQISKVGELHVWFIFNERFIFW